MPTPRQTRYKNPIVPMSHVINPCPCEAQAGDKFISPSVNNATAISMGVKDAVAPCWLVLDTHVFAGTITEEGLIL